MLGSAKKSLNLGSKASQEPLGTQGNNKAESYVRFKTTIYFLMITLKKMFWKCLQTVLDSRGKKIKIRLKIK